MTALTPIPPAPVLEKVTVYSVVTLEVKHFQNEDIEPIAKVWLEIETDGVEYALNVSKYLLTHPEIEEKVAGILYDADIEDDDDEDGKWYKSSETVEEQVELEFEAWVDKENKEVYLRRVEGTEVKRLEISEYLSSDELEQLF